VIALAGRALRTAPRGFRWQAILRIRKAEYRDAALQPLGNRRELKPRIMSYCVEAVNRYLAVYRSIAI
jgi:hypothetical protein